MLTSRESGPEYTLQHLETSLKKAIDESNETDLDNIIMNATQGADSVDYDPYAVKYQEIMDCVASYAVTKKKWKMFSALEEWNSPDSVNGGETYSCVKLPTGKTILITAFEKNRNNLLSKLIYNALMSKAFGGIGLDRDAYQFQTDLNEIINNSEPNKIFKYVHELINKSVKELKGRGAPSVLIKAKQFQECFKVFEQKYRKASNPRTLSLYLTTLEMAPPISTPIQRDDLEPTPSTPSPTQRDEQQSPHSESKAKITFFAPAPTLKTSSTLSPAILAALNDLNQKATDPTCTPESLLLASKDLTTILSLITEQKAQADKKLEMVGKNSGCQL